MHHSTGSRVVQPTEGPDTLNPAPLTCPRIYFLVLGTEAKDLHVLNKHATTEPFAGKSRQVFYH